MKSFQDISNGTILMILRFIGIDKDVNFFNFLNIFLVCKDWYNRLDATDAELWKMLAVDCRVDFKLKNGLTMRKTLRSTTNLKKSFFKSYAKKQILSLEKHDQLIMEIKNLFESKKCAPLKMQKLIKTLFPNLLDFDINYKSHTIENYSLITLAARYQHLKCMRLLIEYYNADIEICDVGGFTPLILSAYGGSLRNVMYLIKRGANIKTAGRLRSGKLLTAEHWAAVQGYQEIFKYLRAIRMRQESKILPVANSSAKMATESELGVTDRETANLMLLAELSSKDNETQGPTTFCICGKGFVGNMIACDHNECLVEWFHFECVGLAREPEGEWICAACKGESFSQPISSPLQRGVRKYKKRKISHNNSDNNNNDNNNNSSNNNNDIDGDTIVNNDNNWNVDTNTNNSISNAITSDDT